MKTIARFFTWCSLLAAGLFLFAGCASYTYETQSWRIAEANEDSADVIVRYFGVGSTSKDVKKRAEKAKEIIELAADKNPKNPITPRLKNAHRKVYLQDGKVVIEEMGTINNPLSWFEQTGLNIFTWFNDPIDLSIVGRYIVKSADDGNNVLLATNGRVIDEDIFSSSILKLDTPLAIGGDTIWQNSEPRDITDLSEPEKRQLIVWPRASRLFYWKFSGPAYNKKWQNLAPEVSALINSMKSVTTTNNVNKKAEEKTSESKN